VRLFGKKEKVVKRLSPEVKRHIAIVKARHNNRISNLEDELGMLKKKLREIESDIEMPKTEASKKTDTVISRMVHIKYEVGIRKELVIWL